MSGEWEREKKQGRIDIVLLGGHMLIFPGCLSFEGILESS